MKYYRASYQCLFNVDKSKQRQQVIHLALMKYIDIWSKYFSFKKKKKWKLRNKSNRLMKSQLNIKWSMWVEFRGKFKEQSEVLPLRACIRWRNSLRWSFLVSEAKFFVEQTVSTTDQEQKRTKHTEQDKQMEHQAPQKKQETRIFWAKLISTYQLLLKNTGKRKE